MFREACYQGSRYLPLLDAARESWDELGAELGRQLIRPARALLIGNPDGQALAGCLPGIRSRAERFEELTATDMRTRFPSFRLAPDMVAILESRAGIVVPEDCIEASLSRARAAGAELRTDEPVLGWDDTGDGLRVRTARAEYRTRRLALAAGAWTNNLAAELDLPLVVERAVQYWFEPAPECAARFEPADCPAWVWEHEPGSSWYGFPRTDRGVKLGLHRQTGRRTDPMTIDREVGREEEASMRRVLKRFMPDASGRRAGASVCMYTTTPDEAPILDRHPDHPEVAFFAGGSGHCFKFALVLGRLLADLSADCEPEFDLVAFRMDRF